MKREKRAGNTHDKITRRVRQKIKTGHNRRYNPNAWLRILPTLSRISAIMAGQIPTLVSGPTFGYRYIFKSIGNEKAMIDTHVIIHHLGVIILQKRD